MKLCRLSCTALIVATLTLSGCGGGSESPPVAPATQWKPPLLGALTAKSLIGAFPDANGGVIVAGSTDAGGVAIARFSDGAWLAETLEMAGLGSVQAVAIKDGVALFGRDSSQWFRTTVSSTGIERLKPQFSAEQTCPQGNSSTSLSFSSTHDGAVLATWGCADLTTGTAYIQMRELKQGTWAVTESVKVTGWSGSFAWRASVARSRFGDAATVIYVGPGYEYSFVAFRSVGAADFAIVTPTLCTNGRCQANWGGYFAPVLQPDGSATVLRGGNSPFRDDWLSVRALTPVSLWTTSTTPADFSAPPSSSLVRANGTPVWLANVDKQLTLWEGTQMAVWSPSFVTPPACSLATCAAIDRADASRFAAVDLTTSTAPVLNIYSRANDGIWSREASVDLISVRTASGASSEIDIAKLAVERTLGIVLGGAGQPNPATDQRFTVFAVAKK